MDDSLATTVHPMNTSLLKGMFHTMAPVNEDLPFVIPYSAVYEIYAFVKVSGTGDDKRITTKFDQPIGKDGSFIIWIKYHNQVKGTKIALGLQAYGPRSEVDPDATANLFNSLLANREQPAA